MSPTSLRTWLIDVTARVPLSIRGKLLIAFLTIVGMLVVFGAVGLHMLSGVNEQTENLIKLQRKIAAYRQVQHDATNQLYGVATAQLSPDAQSLDNVLRQLNQFGYDFDRLAFVAKDESDLLGQVRQDYNRFTEAVTRIVALIRDGRLEDARQIQAHDIAVLADRIERQTSQLVNIAEADIVAGIDSTVRTYRSSQYVVAGVALASILVALGLGYIISWSLIRPVTQIEAGLREIAGGEFSRQIRVVNRDELGRLADHVDRTREELGRLYAKLADTTAELEVFNRTLEERVSAQVDEIARIGRLKRFVAPQLASAIVENTDTRLLASHRREITVLFADLRGFTRFSETAEPERLMGVLQQYHDAIGRLIHDYEATLERFAGDGVMVYFNDPLPCPDPAARAVRLAVAMRARVRALAEGWRQEGDDLGFGVGIAMGYATLGEIGFEGRVDYAAIGPVTNLASRLCDEARDGQILITRRVMAAAAEAAVTEPVGALSFKGLAQPVAVFNVVDAGEVKASAATAAG
jgi:class 3 adenylate cyclase/HAMP domain-containing protein